MEKRKIIGWLEVGISIFVISIGLLSFYNYLYYRFILVPQLRLFGPYPEPSSWDGLSTLFILVIGIFGFCAGIKRLKK